MTFQTKQSFERELRNIANETEQLLGELNNPNKTYLDGIGGSRKSVGDYLLDTPAFKSRSGGVFTASVDAPFDISNTKATFLTTGLTRQDYRTEITEYPRDQVRIADLISSGSTDAANVRFLRSDAFTNAATEVAEGALKPEATITLAEIDAPTRKIAVRARVSDEALDDYASFRGFMNNELIAMLRLRLDNQLLNGSGVAPNILGLLTAGSGIQTQSKGADAMQTSILKAQTKVRTGAFMEPDAIVINPADYEALRLLRDGGATGQYLGGGFMTGAFGQPFVETPPIWGMRPVITPLIAAGFPLVGAFHEAARIFYRNSLTVEATNSNQDDFEKNLVSIRAEQRLAFAILQPLGFVKLIA